ncbi:MAG: glutamyl-tRNA reductase [Melioribacteraceae bacterium]|nr:glutamyl-tRNA reductase [Melioribacteraceae bacterium]
MNIVGISINHRTAPIELREALHLSDVEITELISGLKEDLLAGGFVLSTCNRTELFGVQKDGKAEFYKLFKYLTNFKEIKQLSSQNFEKYFSCSAVKHIFKVASGIDSLLIGDSQILGQIKESFLLAEDLQFTNSVLKRLFDTAVKVGRRSIKETRIGEGAVTVSFAAVQVVEKIFANPREKSALVIGTGETGKLAATHLTDLGVGKLTLANRTRSKAEILAQNLQAEVIDFTEIIDHLHEFDIIFSATSSEKFIIDKDAVKSAMKKRKGNPVCMMDIALPRDINPAVKELDNVFYNDIDSLGVIVDQNIKKRKAEIPLVNKIIMEEMVGFYSWYNTLNVVPTIKAVREFFETMGNDELEKIKHKVSREDYIKIEDMTRRLLGRLLHNPTMNLREVAESGLNSDEVALRSMMIKELFNLNGNVNSSQNKDDKNL